MEVWLCRGCLVSVAVLTVCVGRFSLESSQVHGDRLETHLQACLATSHAQSRPYLPSSSSSAGAGQGGAGEGEDGGAGGCGLPGDDQQDRSSTTSSSAGADGTSGGGVAREDKSSLEEVCRVQLSNNENMAGQFVWIYSAISNLSCFLIIIQIKRETIKYDRTSRSSCILVL